MRMQVPEPATLPDPVEIRRVAQDVLSRPYFEIEAAPRDTSKLLELIWEWIEWFLTPIGWLFDAAGALPAGIGWILITLLLIALIALVAHGVYVFVAAIRNPARSVRFSSVSAVGTDPDALEAEAATAVSRADYIGAIRLLFRAGLLRICAVEKRPFRNSLTNREHLSRYRNTRLFDALRQMVETIEMKWYGSDACTEADYQLCRAAHSEILHHVRERAHAHVA